MINKCHFFLLKMILWIRHTKFVSAMTSLFGSVMGPKYDGKYLHSRINNLLGDLTLKQTLTHVIIPTFDIKLLQPVIFMTNNVWVMTITSRLKISAICWNICDNYMVSTGLIFLCREKRMNWKTLGLQIFASAPLQHPLIFQHTTLRQQIQKETLEIMISLMAELLLIILWVPNLIIWGTFGVETLENWSFFVSFSWYIFWTIYMLANSLIYFWLHPQTMLAISQIRKELLMAEIEFGNSSENKKMLVLSLGTGGAKYAQRYTAPAASKWGVLNWLYTNGGTPLLDSYDHASADVVDFHVSTLFQALRCKDNYLRIQVSNDLYISSICDII